MFFYSIYGTTLCSEVFFPELKPVLPTKLRPVVTLLKCKSPLPGWPSSKDAWKPFDGYEYAFSARRDRTYLRTAGAGNFLIRFHQKTIEWVPSSDRSLESLGRLLLRGKAIGLLLSSFPSTLILHANVLLYRGKGVIFCASKGQGKSTLTAALLSAGFSLLSDDVAVIYRRKNNFFLQPGPPEIRLWPPALRRFRAAIKKAHPLYPGAPKKKILLGNNSRWIHWGGTASLERLYVLSRRTKGPCRIEPLSARESFLEVLKHIYMPLLEGQEDQIRQFKIIRRLIEKSPVRRFVFPTGLGQLDPIAAILRRDIDRG